MRGIYKRDNSQLRDNSEIFGQINVIDKQFTYPYISGIVKHDKKPDIRFCRCSCGWVRGVTNLFAGWQKDDIARLKARENNRKGVL